MEHFVENDEHTLFDYRYKCRVCLIKLETEESFKLDKELKSKFYTITGLKLRSNRNYSNILCLICQRDLLCFCYFKERATKIQMYLNKKGEDCINGSETEDEAMIEGFPTFFLNDEDELSETTHTDKSIEIETEIISRKMNSIIVLENILIQPSVSCCTSEPKPITEEFDMKNQRPLEALQLKPSIPDQNNSDKKENKAELMKNINSIEKPSKQVLQTKEKHELPSNTKNVSIDTNIQNTENVEKSLKKGFPKICSRRQSVRVLSRVKIEKPIVHARPIDKKLPSTIEPMQTRSKTNSKRCKTDVIVQVLDFQDPKPKKKVATKMPKIPITHEM